MLRVFKFGGASINSAQGVRNLVNILSSSRQPLIVVVSAMGKNTNLLERILKDYMDNHSAFKENFNRFKKYHLDIINELFGNSEHNLLLTVNSLLDEVEDLLDGNLQGDYNFCYDQLVSYGELLSSAIISDYAQYAGVKNQLIDVRKVLICDETYREGLVDLKASEKLVKERFVFKSNSPQLYFTQGFIAGTRKGTTITLGREGSDYSAAILANLLNAEDVTIWKDVEGVLNADPKSYPNPVKLDEISFKEAIELAYAGAQIIHPKTIKPLQNKGIKLFVKSFHHPQGEGTLVYETASDISYPPILIKKSRQVLISLTPLDFSFVIEDCLSRIFAILFTHRVKANLVQSTAINFSFCVDDEEYFLPGAMKELSKNFAVRYNRQLELITIRHYTKEAIADNIQGKTIYLQQKTRSTIRMVLGNKQ